MAAIPVELNGVKALLGIPVATTTYDSQINTIIALYDNALESQIDAAYLGGALADQDMIKLAKTEIIAARSQPAIPMSAVGILKSFKSGSVEEQYDTSSGRAGESLNEAAAWKKIERFLIEDSPYNTKIAPAFGIAEVAYTDMQAEQIEINAVMRQEQ